MTCKPYLNLTSRGYAIECPHHFPRVPNLRLTKAKAEEIIRMNRADQDAEIMRLHLDQFPSVSVA